MKEQKFRIGDLVKSRVPVGHNGVENAIGRVVGIAEPDSKNPSICVQFSSDIAVYSPYGLMKTYNGWWCNPDNLVIVKKHRGRPFGFSPKKKANAERKEDKKDEKEKLPLGLEYEADDKQKEEPKTNCKFKVGDRVKAIEPVGGKEKIGVCGTVIGFCCQLVTVEFDEDIDGHDGALCGREGKDNYCWHCPEQDIELVDQSETKEDKIVSLLEQILEEIKGLKHTEVEEEKENPLASIFDDVLDKIRKDEKTSSEKFSVGDRVTPKKGERNSGIKGTIIGFFDGFFGRRATVEFDEKIPDGHNGINCDTKGKDGYCWNYPLYEIELIKKGR